MGAIDPERIRELAEELAGIEDEIARRYRLYSALILEESEPEGEEEYQQLVQAIRDQAQRDREENVLFQLWMRERLLKGPLDLEIEEFSEVVAGRALVRLLHYVPRGQELLSSLDPSDRSWIPDKAHIRKFVLSGGLAEQDPQQRSISSSEPIRSSSRSRPRSAENAILGNFQESGSKSGRSPGVGMSWPVFSDSPRPFGSWSWLGLGRSLREFGTISKARASRRQPGLSRRESGSEKG
jgi:hypothetical protein